MSKKHKKDWMTLNYIVYLLILLSNITGFSTVGLKTCVITAEIKTVKSIIRKKRQNHSKKVLLATTKLKTMEVLISRSLIDSYVSQSVFVSVGIELRAKQKFI